MTEARQYTDKLDYRHAPLSLVHQIIILYSLDMLLLAHFEAMLTQYYACKSNFDLSKYSWNRSLKHVAHVWIKTGILIID